MFQKDGLTTVGEYFDMTIYCVILNILAFLLIFFLLRVLFTLLTNAYSYSAALPMLQRFDSVAGGGIALIRGFFSMHVVFMLIPVLAHPAAGGAGFGSAQFLFYEHSLLFP